MTKLQNPIIITLETVEDATLFWHVMNASALRSIEQYTKDRITDGEVTIEALVNYKSAIWETVNKQLYDQHVNPHTALRGKLASKNDKPTEGKQ